MLISSVLAMSFALLIAIGALVYAYFCRQRAQARCERYIAELTQAKQELADQIHEREKTEEELREKQQRFRAMYDRAYEFIGLLQPDGIMLDANQTALDFAGIQLESVLNKHFTETPWWQDCDESRQQLSVSIPKAASGEFVRFEARHGNAKGEMIDVDFSLNPIKDCDGNVILLIPEGRDITSLKNTEAALRQVQADLENQVVLRTQELANTNQELQLEIHERRAVTEALKTNEARLTGIVNSAMDAIISIDSEHNIVLFNQAAELMFGYQAEELIGKPLSVLLPPGYEANHREHVRRFGATGVTTRSMGALNTISGIRRNGQIFPIEASISQMSAGEQKLYTVILRDITRRKQAQEQLIEQAALLNHAREAIATCDMQGNVLFWNRGAERLYGLTSAEALGINFNTALNPSKSPAPYEAWQSVLRDGEWRGELRQHTKTDKEIYVEGHFVLVRDEAGNPKSVLIINTDITEKKKLESQFLRAQRMESIGTLAGGIAHDLNNILSPITMGVQMLQLKHADDFSKQMLEVMATNAKRGSEMIKQILSFARGTSGAKLAVQTKHLIKEAVKMLHDTLPKNINVVTRFSGELHVIEGDPTQLHQVLLNLCVNARDAMPNGGTLTISAENVNLEAEQTRLIPNAHPGAYTTISVADTGEGIQPENIERIFDPFFTTKELGKGTGLGLSTVMGIIKGHKGFINVYSEPGRGTKFVIYLPAKNAALTLQASAEKLQLPIGREQLILVVDDEISIREMTEKALTNFGYRVLLAENGHDALAQFQARKNEISLVLTDMMMPIMDGPALIQALRQDTKELPIIACSGLAVPPLENVTEHIALILEKPLNVESLLHAVSTVLNKQTA